MDLALSEYHFPLAPHVLAISALVPAPSYSWTSAAGAHARKPSSCARAMLLTHICCKHVRLNRIIQACQRLGNH